MCEDITTTEDTTATLQSSTSLSASLINSITTPLSLLITAWLLDMIDSCSIEKLPIYSSVTHFLFFRFRGRLEDTSICCSHNKAYVEFIRNNKPVTVCRSVFSSSVFDSFAALNPRVVESGSCSAGTRNRSFVPVSSSHSLRWVSVDLFEYIIQFVIVN